MQNSRKNSKLNWEIPELKEKTQGLGKFYSSKVKDKCQNEFLCAEKEN